MTELANLHGTCLCGKVEVHLDQVKPHVGACHCPMCLQWCGGPGFAIDVDDNIRFTGEDAIKVYKSSAWAERGFCNTCGSNIFYRLQNGSKYFVYAGLFKDDPSLILDHQIYIDFKPAYYNFAEQTPKLTGAEVEAMFAVDADSNG